MFLKGKMIIRYQILSNKTYFDSLIFYETPYNVTNFNIDNLADISDKVVKI